MFPVCRTEEFSIAMTRLTAIRDMASYNFSRKQAEV
jgi:hypothetical protein